MKKDNKPAWKDIYPGMTFRYKDLGVFVTQQATEGGTWLCIPLEDIGLDPKNQHHFYMFNDSFISDYQYKHWTYIEPPKLPSMDDKLFIV